MKVIDVQVICSRKNNAMTWDDVVPDMFFFDINLKFDNTTNLLQVFGSSRGKAYCNLAKQCFGATFTLLDVPTSIRNAVDRVIGKCDGFSINEGLLDDVTRLLTMELSGIEFEFSDRDKERLSDADVRRKYGYNGPDYA